MEIPSFSLPPFSASFTFNMPSYQRIVKVIVLASWPPGTDARLWNAYGWLLQLQLVSIWHFSQWKELIPCSRVIIVAPPPLPVKWQALWKHYLLLPAVARLRWLVLIELLLWVPFHINFIGYPVQRRWPATASRRPDSPCGAHGNFPLLTALLNLLKGKSRP
jgi:hypothetical protein